MPRRRAKNKSWEVESERMVVTLGIRRRIWKGVVSNSEKLLEEFSNLEGEDKYFYQLPGVALAAFNLKRYTEAGEFARRALDVAELYKDNWNYGNAIHLGHTVLGLLALRSGDVQTAIAELRESGNTPGSPQLRSFGPMMRLAKELLETGRTEEVVEFIQQCRGFWGMGERWLFIWEKKIMRGVIPNFFMNLYR